MMDAAAVDVAVLCHCTKLKRATRHLTRFYDAQIAYSGLRITQYSILGHLKLFGPLPMLELAAHLTMDRATIGHNLRPLERDGLVRIDVSPKDRRVRLISVTEAGLERFAFARPGWERAQAQFEDEIGETSTRDLQKVIREVIACDLEDRNTGEPSVPNPAW